MSAFLVADKTINRVVTFLEGKFFHEWPILGERFRKAGFKISDEQFCHKLGGAMFALNIKAVNARYSDKSAEEFRTLDYKYQPTSAYPIQVYKSLGCWLYQCTEGNVPSEKLFKLMKDVEFSLANWIVHGLPEYDAAEWG